MQGGTLQAICKLYTVSVHGLALVVGAFMQSCSQLHRTSCLLFVSMDCVLQLLKRDAAFEGVRKKRSRFYAMLAPAANCPSQSQQLPTAAMGPGRLARLLSSVTELIGNTPMVYLESGELPSLC